MKTLAQWQKSGKRLVEFLEAGDQVDQAMYFYFFEVLPPFESHKGFQVSASDGRCEFTTQDSHSTFIYMGDEHECFYYYVGSVSRERFKQKRDELVDKIASSYID